MGNADSGPPRLYENILLLATGTKELCPNSSPLSEFVVQERCLVTKLWRLWWGNSQVLCTWTWLCFSLWLFTVSWKTRSWNDGWKLSCGQLKLQICSRLTAAVPAYFSEQFLSEDTPLLQRLRSYPLRGLRVRIQNQVFCSTRKQR